MTKLTAIPYKGYIIPDQDWFGIFEAIDDQIIGPLLSGALEKQSAYYKTFAIVHTSARTMYQCNACGRIYIRDRQGNLQCYVPAHDETEKEILRSRDSERQVEEP